MAKINLRNYYPFYSTDIFIDVPENIAVALLEAERQEEAYKRRMYRHNAQYSLDQGDGIEYDVLFVSLSPYEIFERKITYKQLHTAIATLPDKQAKRIYAHFFMGMCILRHSAGNSHNIRPLIRMYPASYPHRHRPKAGKADRNKLCKVFHSIA